MILVVFGGVNHRAGLHTYLLEQVPNFLINVLLSETNRYNEICSTSRLIKSTPVTEDRTAAVHFL